MSTMMGEVTGEVSKYFIRQIQFVQTNQSDWGGTDLPPYSLKSQINTRFLFANNNNKKADDFYKWQRKKSGGKAFIFHKQLTGMALAWFNWQALFKMFRQAQSYVQIRQEIICHQT